MDDTVKSDEPDALVDASTEAPTQRLAFDKEVDESEIPQFLKKNRKAKAKDEPVPEDEEEKDPTPPATKSRSTRSARAEKPVEPVQTDIPIEPEMPATQPVPSAAMNEAALQSLAELTIEQLKAQQAEIDRRIQEKQAAEKQGVIAQVVQVVKDYEIPIEELVEALGGFKFRRKGTKAKAKYRDPATGTTWSGRGKEPAWIKGQADRTPFEI